MNKNLGLPAFYVRAYLRAIATSIATSLEEGDQVNIENFGTFKLQRLPERTVRANIEGTLREIKLGASTVPDFIVDEQLKSNINLKNAGAQTPAPVDVDEQFRSYLFHTRKTDVTYIELLNKTIPKNILNTIPENIARKYKIAPFALDNNVLHVAMTDPENEETFNVIRKSSGKIIKPYISTEEEINHVLDQYSSIQNELKEIEKSADSEELETVEESKEEDQDMSETNETAPAAKIVASLLKRAVRDKASDIHIEPQEEEIIVRFRIDGMLRKVLTLPKEIQSAVISRIKILSNLKLDESRLPQDGRIQILLDGNKVDFRVSTFPIVTGEKIVMRVLDHSRGIITLDNLGLIGRSYEILSENIKKSHGMILVTGPTGSGKSTTLYAIIDKIKNDTINIVTMEDPVEYRMSEVNQSQVNSKIDYTFATGLRAILRQDPNVVMVGEIRDRETADIAINAALTGHVVLSSLHTNDASGALPRLLDMDIEPFLITSSVNTIIGQRLCRKICDKCKTEDKPNQQVIDAITKAMSDLPEDSRPKTELKTYHGEGCDECSKTGFKGRVGIFELLDLSDNIKELTMKRASTTDILNQAKKEGMITLRQDGILKALQGVTTAEEVWRVTKN